MEGKGRGRGTQPPNILAYNRPYRYRHFSNLLLFHTTFGIKRYTHLGEQVSQYTGNTGVFGVEVGDEVAGAGDRLQQRVFGHWNVALSASRALGVHLPDDVGDAADVVVAREAATEVHAAVDSPAARCCPR